MKDAVESLGRVRTQGILILVIVFIAGGLAGAMFSRLRMMRGMRQRFADMDRRPDNRPDNRPPDNRPPGEFPVFFDKLDLTPDQREQIHTIFEANRPMIDSLMGETMPKIRDLRDSAEAQINAILTPDQREQFEKLSPHRRFPMGDWRRPFDSGDGEGMRRRGPR